VGAHALPSAEAQLVFLGKLQRIFTESDFTATYKFALLMALADLAVELGADDGEELPLSIRQIAERFIQLYWPQALPYGTGRASTSPGILVQNNGVQAAVVSAILAFRTRHGAANAQLARALPEYPALLGAVAQTVSAQPLNYLQNFGGMTDAFLYERAGAGQLKLKPGMAYCLRRFQPLVQQLARSHWVEHIKRNRRNAGILGQADDLEDFLFSASRQSLLAMGQGLRKLEGNRCFYCAQALTEADVDHFIAFSQYPRDLAHNFVLAHPTCNRSKSDTLAGGPHLERWLERIGRHADALHEIGMAAGMLADAQVSRKIAAWGYTTAIARGGSAWLAPGRYEAIDQRYSAYFTL
jgi:5-methylcytosine-specific restriction endonuclease McrA